MDESTLSRMASDPGEMSCDEDGIFADNEEDAEAYYAYMSARPQSTQSPFRGSTTCFENKEASPEMQGPVLSESTKIGSKRSAAAVDGGNEVGCIAADIESNRKVKAPRTTSDLLDTVQRSNCGSLKASKEAEQKSACQKVVRASEVAGIDDYMIEGWEKIRDSLEMRVQNLSMEGENKTKSKFNSNIGNEGANKFTKK